MQRGATGKSTSAISTQDAEARVFERRMRRPYLMKLRHRSPWVHCCTCTCKCIIDDHCVIFSVSLISWINSSFCMLYWPIKASRAGFVSRLLGRWVSSNGENTKPVWFIEPATILPQDWETSLQVYINALQMPSDLEAVSSTGWTEVHWRDGKQGCSRSMLALLIALIALNHFECCCTLLCKRSAAWGSEKCYGNSGKEGLEWRGCVSTFFDPFPTPVTSILPGIGWITTPPVHAIPWSYTGWYHLHGFAGTIWLHREEGESRLLQLFRRSDAWDATKQADQQSWGKAAQEFQ